jgi:uncharacterized protein YgiM (DUF1202 family)
MKKMLLLTAAMVVAMSTTASAAYICNLNSDLTNVRAGPSARDYMIIDKLDNGYNVRVVNQAFNANGYLWVRVVYNSFRYNRPTVESGWVSGDLVCG